MSLDDELRKQRKASIDHLVVGFIISTGISISRYILQVCCPDQYVLVVKSLGETVVSGVTIVLVCYAFITSIILLIRRLMKRYGDFLALLSFVNQFFWGLARKCRQDGKCRNEIFLPIKSKKAICSIDIQIDLKAYQFVLYHLINEGSVKALKWTNILPPDKVVGSPHESAFAGFKAENGKKKTRICIIGSENIEEWEKEVASKEGKFKDFKENSILNGGQLGYASESALRKFHKESVSLGDYAIIEYDNHSPMMVSYNPVTKNRKLGEVSFTFGDLGNYPNIFEFFEVRSSSDENCRALFDTYDDASKMERKLAEEEKRKDEG